MVLQAFFIDDKLSLSITEPDKESWKREHDILLPVILPSPPIRSTVFKEVRNVHFLTITVWNHDDYIAENCETKLVIKRSPKVMEYLKSIWDSLPPDPHQSLVWQKEFTDPIELKENNILQLLPKYFDRVIGIKPKLPANPIVLFTIVGEDKAYLTSERLTPLEIPSKTDVTISATCSDFTKSLDFRITLEPKLPPKIEEINAWLHLRDDLRKVYSFLHRCYELSRKFKIKIMRLFRRFLQVSSVVLGRIRIL